MNFNVVFKIKEETIMSGENNIITVSTKEDLKKALKRKYKKIILFGEMDLKISQMIDKAKIKKGGGIGATIFGLALSANPLGAGIGAAMFFGGIITGLSAGNLNKYTLYEDDKGTRYLLRK
jgi:hypothetical protein